MKAQKLFKDVPGLRIVLKPSHRRVLTFLAAMASRQPSRECWWGKDKLAQALDASPSTMRQALQRLAQFGFVAGVRWVNPGEKLPDGAIARQTVRVYRIDMEPEGLLERLREALEGKLAEPISTRDPESQPEIRGAQMSPGGSSKPRGLKLTSPGGSNRRAPGAQMSPELTLGIEDRIPSSPSFSRGGARGALGVTPDGATVGHNAGAHAPSGDESERSDSSPSGAGTVAAALTRGEGSDAPPVGGAGRVDARRDRELGATGEVSPEEEKTLKMRRRARAVLRYWRDQLHPNLHKFTLESSIAHVTARLAEGFAVSDLRAAVDGARVSDYNRASPTRQSVRWVFGTADRVQALAAVARRGGASASGGGGGGVPPGRSANGRPGLDKGSPSHKDTENKCSQPAKLTKSLTREEAEETRKAAERSLAALEGGGPL